MKELCIDISTWQKGINYNEIRQKMNYVILRGGFSTTTDNQFETHYNNLQGLNLGVYWYSYAKNENEARAEANKCLQVINGKQFTLPIFLDMEDPSISGIGRNQLNANIRAFGETIQNAGYYFAVYTNVNWYRNIISGTELNKSYDWWIASWGSNQPSGINYGVWQYTNSYAIGGMRVDANYIFKDYPTIIREAGLNHLTPSSNFKYRSHLEGIGWQEWKQDGQTSGTTGESRRLEAIQIDAPFEIEAKAHIQDKGWIDYGKINKDTIIGTTGESLRLECLQLKGNFKYRVHIQDVGWSTWTNADGIATLGSVGQALRIEAIEMIQI